MKICLLTRFFDFRNAGLGRISTELLRRLRERGHEVVPVSVDKPGLKHYFWYTLWGIRRDIPKDCDVYHALTPMETLWLPKGKSIVSFNDLILMTNPELSPSNVGSNRIKLGLGVAYFTFHAYQAARCNKIVCISELTKDDVVRLLGVGSSRITVIRQGIPENLAPRPKPDDTFRIGYLGQLDKRKRVDLLIKAFQNSAIGGELVIAGTGPEEFRLKALAHGFDKRPDSRIKFETRIYSNDELADFYNSLDVLIFPTSVEGYGLPMVEAMGCKKPVVVLDDAIIPEKIKARCVVTDGLDSFLRYIHNMDFGHDSLEANYEFAKCHSWDKCVDEYEELYKEVTK